MKKLELSKDYILGALKRWGLVAIFTGVLAFIVQARFVLDDDPIRSLRSQSGPEAELFDRYHEKSVFDGKVFLEVSRLTDGELADVQALMEKIGYKPAALFKPPTADMMASFLPLLPEKAVEAALSDEAVDSRADEALSFAFLPGGATILGQVKQDPLGLGQAFLKETLDSLGFSNAGGDGRPAGRILAFDSPSPIVYDEVGLLYDKLTALGDRVNFIGADFYAYESYRDAQHDIVVCTALSTLVNLILFFFFTRRFGPMVLLLAGSGISYLSGILVVGVFYERVFAVVLAFASTFVGFNNEYLVHLSALPQGSGKKSLLGVWSAVGTTLLGFLVLLAGSSVIVRQMALASLGGMAGFLVVLYIFRKQLNEIRYRTFHWRKFTISKKALVAVSVASLLAIALIPKPKVATDVKDFRNDSPLMSAQEKYFMGRLGEVKLSHVVAVPVEDAARLSEDVDALVAQGRVDMSVHPLKVWRPVDSQEKTIALLKAKGPDAVRRMAARLDESGLDLGLSDKAFDGLAPIDAYDFLASLNAMTPAKWADQVGGKKFVFASGVPDKFEVEGGPKLTPMNPKDYFDGMLTGLSRELGLLFLLGLVAMCGYLIALHKKPYRVLYVFVPLMLIAAAFLGIGALDPAGGQLTIIHVVGFALVIALATDYASVAMSVDHHEVELSKILITSLSTLGTFGVLLIARNPVIAVLGYTVTLACVIATPYALFLKLPKEVEAGEGAADSGASGKGGDGDAASPAAAAAPAAGEGTAAIQEVKQ